MQPLQHPNDVEIPTVVNTRADDPARFPMPTIYVCEINQIEIFTVDRDSQEERISLVPVLKASTWEDVNTDTSLNIITGPVDYYHITREVKNCIYGKVYHALKLEVLQSTDIPLDEISPHPPPFNWQGGGRYSLRHLTPHVEIAVKVYFKSRIQSMSGKTYENPLNEFSAMQFLGHRNKYIMGQIGLYQDGDSVYSLMEYCDGGELFDQLAPGPLPEERARRYFVQIVNGLEYCHSKGVAHRDMSLENIIYNRREDYVKIIDFGMCLFVPRDEATGAFLFLKRQGRCGKKNYIAPEVMQDAQPFNPMKADIWALGVILFTMLSGFPPVDSALTADPRYRMISAGHLRTLIDNWNVSHLLSDSVIGLIEGILRPNPGDRLTLSEILSHPWCHGEMDVNPGNGSDGQQANLPSWQTADDTEEDSKAMMEAG